ncbi:MAG TPA: efflux RND transporter permease subunit [Alphaproteobacteria bacterium]|nr:efflux RND transporter permease subunit [Alphaproteobacteria bacterium]
MGRFSIRYPYFIVVCFLIISVIGLSSIIRMPVDLFPPIKIPVVVVATFYSGMPAEEIETSITGRFERFFTLGSGIDHIESKSLNGVSLIKIYFQPGMDADAAVTEITNLAMADLRKLPAGTLPPVVLKFDASSLPLCLITLKAQGLNEAQLRDMGQYNVRNQVANVPGASVPQPFGGKYRQIMVYVDPLKLEANQLSVMDVVRSINDANLILPAGDVKIGPLDYTLFTNSQIDDVHQINSVPLKTVGNSWVTVGDVGYAKDGSQIQYNVVRVDGQPSVYLPVLKQGGDSNTIAVVDGVKNALAHLVDVPTSLVAKVMFDQSIFVKNAIKNLIDEGAIGLVLTGVMILVFLASPRGTIGAFLSIPLSVMTAFVVLYFGGSTINSMILGGLALAFSRVIDNSVIVLENIFRHIEHGEEPHRAAEVGAQEVALPVLAATLTTALVFFPVVFLFGVSRYLFTALALAVVLSLFASYFVALTILPLFCAKFLKPHVASEHAPDRPSRQSWGARFSARFNAGFEAMLVRYDRLVARVLVRPRANLALLLGASLAACTAIILVQQSYFPRTDPGQFVINLKVPTGTRLEDTTETVAKVENIIRSVVDKSDLGVVVSNIGVTPGFSSMYTSNTASHTAFVQASLKAGHRVGSYEYMDRVRKAIARQLPEVTTYFQTGGLVDAVLNLGLPAPIDLQVTGSNLDRTYGLANKLASQIRAIPGVSDVFIPQDNDAPSFRLDIDRLHAGEMGLSEKEIVSDVITAVNSNQMIAPNYWVDPKSGNDYMLTVQYPETTVKTLSDLKAIPLRSPNALQPTRLDTVADVKPILSPTLVSHYQLARVIDIYVSPSGEDLARVSSAIDRILAKTEMPRGVRVNIQGSVNAMHSSFSSFGSGLLLATLLVYLILVAQFRSVIDPLIILLAIPPGLAGVIVTLWLTGTSLNVMSLMGVIMLVGIAVSNSILIVEFAHRLWTDARSVREAVALACRVRLRPVLMTSLATMIGLIPMALGLGEGSEAYSPLARAIIGGLGVSVAITVFIVPAAFVAVYERKSPPHRSTAEAATA